MVGLPVSQEILRFYTILTCFLSVTVSVLCGGQELPGVQAETERSKLQVVFNQQQVPGQPPQCLHHQQGTKHKLNANPATTVTSLRKTCEHWRLSTITSRIQTDSYRTWTSIVSELWCSGTWWASVLMLKMKLMKLWTWGKTSMNVCCFAAGRQQAGSVSGVGGRLLHLGPDGVQVPGYFGAPEGDWQVYQPIREEHPSWDQLSNQHRCVGFLSFLLVLQFWGDSRGDFKSLSSEWLIFVTLVEWINNKQAIMRLPRIRKEKIKKEFYW